MNTPPVQIDTNALRQEIGSDQQWLAWKARQLLDVIDWQRERIHELTATVALLKEKH